MWVSFSLYCMRQHSLPLAQEEVENQSIIQHHKASSRKRKRKDCSQKKRQVLRNEEWDFRSSQLTNGGKWIW